jgi:hypothetical protein
VRLHAGFCLLPYMLTHAAIADWLSQTRRKACPISVLNTVYSVLSQQNVLCCAFVSQAARCHPSCCAPRHTPAAGPARADAPARRRVALDAAAAACQGPPSLQVSGVAAAAMQAQPAVSRTSCCSMQWCHVTSHAIVSSLEPGTCAATKPTACVYVR